MVDPLPEKPHARAASSARQLVLRLRLLQEERQECDCPFDACAFVKKHTLLLLYVVASAATLTRPYAPVVRAVAPSHTRVWCEYLTRSTQT